MEEPFNPYAAGEAQVQQIYVNPAAGLAVTPMALASILSTRFWVKLVGIVMVVISVLNLARAFVGGAPSILILLPLIMSVIYVVMAVRLIQYASAIQKLAISNDSNDLSRAIELQTKFWKMAVILMISPIVLFVVGIVIDLGIASNYR